MVTYTEKLALEQATAADKLLAEGVYLGDHKIHAKEAVYFRVILYTGIILLLEFLWECYLCC